MGVTAPTFSSQAMESGWVRTTASAPSPQLGGIAGAFLPMCDRRSARMDGCPAVAWPVVPDGVEGIVGAETRLARALAIACQLADLTFRMQPGIVTELATSQVLLQPPDSGLGYVAMLIEFGIAFLQRPQRVAAVDEESSPVLKHDSHASRSAEARQPASCSADGGTYSP